MNINPEVISTEKEKVINNYNNNPNNYCEDKKTNIEQAIPKESRTLEETPKNEENINNEHRKKSLINDEDLAQTISIGKKIMNKIFTNLNSYWLEIMGFVNLILSLIIYESIVIIILNLFLLLIEGEFDLSDITDAFNILINNIGIKWIMFIIISNHLSVGFFCLTTFSNVLTDIKDIKMFYIFSIIKAVLFYVFLVILLKVIIRDTFGNFVQKKVESANIVGKERAFEIINPLIDKLVIFVARFLSTYNIFLEKLLLGSIYFFLFFELETISRKKLLIFRLLSLIPILFIIVSLILRALENNNIIKINEYISALLLGPKISVYGYFITTLLEIKYKSLAYDVFDSEKSIDSRVFIKIGSKHFGLFSIIELLIGFFFPKITNIGIGNNYLLILCAPIAAIYDYKRSNKTPFPCCKKGNFSLFFKIIVYFIGCVIVLLLGIYFVILMIEFIQKFIAPIIEVIIDNIDIIKEILKLLLQSDIF